MRVRSLTLDEARQPGWTEPDDDRRDFQPHVCDCGRPVPSSPEDVPVVCAYCASIEHLL